LPTHSTPPWPSGSRIWPLLDILKHEYGMRKDEFTVNSQGIDQAGGRIILPFNVAGKGGTMLRAMMAILAICAAGPVLAGDVFRFASIDGGEIDLADWRGKPVLVVNTASLCGFAGQFDDLQTLHERFGDKVLILAVPSDDFDQELADAAAVKEYCALTFDLTLPMTEITHVKGAEAHPFYAWLRDETGFVPRWNFNKVLIGPDGSIVGTFGAPVSPDSAAIAGRIEAMLE
jgi:glutathione peroxidase